MYSPTFAGDIREVEHIVGEQTDTLEESTFDVETYPELDGDRDSSDKLMDPERRSGPPPVDEVSSTA